MSFVFAIPPALYLVFSRLTFCTASIVEILPGENMFRQLACPLPKVDTAVGAPGCATRGVFLSSRSQT